MKLRDYNLNKTWRTINFVCQAGLNKIKRQKIAIRRSFDIFIWYLPRLGYIVPSLMHIRDAVSPGENFLFFIKNLRRTQKFIRSNKFNKLIADGRGTINYSDDWRKANEENSPIMYLCWHHGARKVERLTYKFDDKAMIFIGYGLNNVNTFRADNLSLAKISKILEDNGRILLFFDGEFGKLDLSGEMFGVTLNFSRTFINLIRKHKINVFPLTQYFSYNDEMIHVQCGPRLFKDVDIASLTDEEALQYVIKYFTAELLKNDKYQLNYCYIFYPEKFELMLS